MKTRLIYHIESFLYIYITHHCPILILNIISWTKMDVSLSKDGIKLQESILKNYIEADIFYHTKQML